jgi:hypothetical protein
MLRSTITTAGYSVAAARRRAYTQAMARSGRLPLWPWLLPAASALGAVVVWTLWGDTQRGTWVGGLLIGLSAILVYALVLEELPHDRRGVVAATQRTLFAAVLGLAAGTATFLAAGLGYYLAFRPFG